MSKNETEEKQIAIPSTTEVMANPDLMNAVKEKAKSLGQEANSGIIVYVKMNKSGEWVHGEKEEEIDEETMFVVNPLSYQYGAVAFSNNDFYAEHLVSAYGSDPIPMPEELEKVDPVDKIEASDGWKPQHGIMWVDAEGGPNMIYKASSVGGIRALEILIGKVGDRMDTNPESCFPVVQLSSSSYKHKKYGKIFTPEITIVAWASNDTAEIVDEVEEVA